MNLLTVRTHHLFWHNLLYLEVKLIFYCLQRLMPATRKDTVEFTHFITFSHLWWDITKLVVRWFGASRAGYWLRWWSVILSMIFRQREISFSSLPAVRTAIKAIRIGGRDCHALRIQRNINYKEGERGLSLSLSLSFHCSIKFQNWALLKEIRGCNSLLLQLLKFIWSLQLCPTPLSVSDFGSGLMWPWRSMIRFSWNGL